MNWLNLFCWLKNCIFLVFLNPVFVFIFVELEIQVGNIEKKLLGNRISNMKDFPSCLGENGVQVADFSSSSANKNTQNLVTCVYHCRLRGKSCWITINWSKNLMGQGFSVGIDYNSSQSLCKVDIKPWLFSKKKGSKSLEPYSNKLDVYWDFSSAKFGSGPVPLDGFYLGIVCERQMILLLGDMKREALKKTSSTPSSNNSVLVAKREHVFGKKIFTTKAQFCDNGLVHDVVIECDTYGITDPCLVIRIDTKPLLQVKRLRWKFRGNHTILVDGIGVELFWDVHSWLFGSSFGNAVFMFKTCPPPPEKQWVSQPLCDPQANAWSWSQRFRNNNTTDSCNLGFSLILYAWKNE